MAAVPESAEWILQAMNDQGRRTDVTAPPPALPVPPSALPGFPEEVRSSLFRKTGKAALFGLYRLVRPVLRPILLRTRAFFTQPMLDEIADFKQPLSAEIASLRHQIEIVRDELGAEIAVLRDELKERAEDRKHEDGQAAASIDGKDFDSLISALRREVEAQNRGGSV